MGSTYINLKRAGKTIVPLALVLILSACNQTKESGKARHFATPALEVQDLLQTGENAFRKGDIKLAHSCFSEALKVAEQADRYSRSVALALNDLALTTSIDRDQTPSGKKNLAQAIAYQKRALELEERYSGSQSTDVAFDLNNLGAWYGANLQWKEGAEALERSAKIREKALGPNSPLLAVTLGNLAENYSQQKRTVEAIDLYKRQAKIYKTIDSPTEAARASDKVAGLYQDLGKNDEAAKVLSEVLSLREKAFGKDSLLVAETLNNMGVCQLAMGKNTEAEPLFARAYKIVCKQDDQDIIKAVATGYKKCLEKLGKTAEAQKLFAGTKSDERLQTPK
ncbi:MAG: tetratricopeptide repeat protein [Cyanobacteria bacterium SZAS TMP-1]|nr:tetratricopeptide repeat protein [Cyanobacteria bacterium SZAS TMP-1]